MIHFTCVGISILNRTYIYIILPEDEMLGSKHVEDINNYKKLKY